MNTHDVPMIDRALAKISIDEATGCWLWQGCKTYQGYGRMIRLRANHMAHRVVYEDLVGPVPDGLVLDHLCRVRHCVNPAHLEPVTNRENILRGTGFAARKAAQSHCVNGHPLSGENIYPYKGGRLCRTCRRARHNTPEQKAKASIYARERWLAGQTTKQRKVASHV